MATIQSVINDLEALLASLKLKLNDEMGIAVPVAEPVVVYATPVDDPLDLIPVVEVKNKQNLEIFVKKMVLEDLPDDILTYIGKFLDIKKREAKWRYKTLNRIYHSIRDAPIEIRWKKLGKSNTKKAVIFNEKGRECFGQKTISLSKEYPTWDGYYGQAYRNNLRIMKERYEKKYWIHQTAFKTITGEWCFADDYPTGNDFLSMRPIAQGDDGYATRCFAPFNLVKGWYMYEDGTKLYYY